MKLADLFQFIISKTFFAQIGIAIILLFVVVFALKWWLGFTTNHEQKIQVPNLHKMSLVEVEQKLEELHLDFIIIDSEKKIQLSAKNNCKIFEIISPIKPPYKTYAEVHNVN